MLALRLLRDRLFATTNLVMAFSMASFVGLLFVLPLYLQVLRGLSPLDSGLVTFPQAIGILITSQVAGRIYATVGPRRLVTGGMVWSAVSVASFVTLDLDTDLWLVRAMVFARGLGMGFTFVAVQAASYARIAPSDNGRASAIFSTQRQMAVSIGVALMATVLAHFTSLTVTPTDPQRALEGYRWSFVVSTVLAVIAAIVATRIRDEDAAATMVRD
jgi:MFS family permease